jgi:hypothetical protein
LSVPVQELLDPRLRSKLGLQKALLQKELSPLGRSFPLLQLRAGDRGIGRRALFPAAILPAPFLSGSRSGAGVGGEPGNQIAVYISTSSFPSFGLLGLDLGCSSSVVPFEGGWRRGLQQCGADSVALRSSSLVALIIALRLAGFPVFHLFVVFDGRLLAADPTSALWETLPWRLFGAGFVRSGSATAMHVSRGVRGRRAGRGRGTAGGRVGVPVAQRSCSPPGALSGGGIELAPLESFDPPLRCFYRACEVGLVLLMRSKRISFPAMGVLVRWSSFLR